jgi:hypothetical protein
VEEVVRTPLVGNPLGDARAEADSLMLKRAFVRTHDYKALTTTRDFDFVVGRRGTEKFALFIKLRVLFRFSQHLAYNLFGLLFLQAE